MTAPPRKRPSLTVLLAATLCALRGKDGERLIPHDEAKEMSAEAVIAKFEFNHYPIPHAEGGPAVHWNLDPELKADHRQITAKVDVPGIAKRKRVRAAHLAHKERMTIKLFGEGGLFDNPKHDGVPIRQVKRKIPSRPFPKVQRPLRSRNDLRRAKP